MLLFPAVCAPVGVEDRNKIPDARITASSSGSSGAFAPHYGRLNDRRGMGAWCPWDRDDRTEYLQVDMGTVHTVCAVTTQGLDRDPTDRALSYKLHLSTDGVTWDVYKENQVVKVNIYIN